MADKETEPQLLQRLGDDAAKWADEFRQTAIKLGYSDMDEGWLTGWFANAIENAEDTRRERKTWGEDQMSHVDSGSDERTVNNTMRHKYRVLSDGEKLQMQTVKDAGLDFHNLLCGLGNSRETSIAKTKLEEAVMWAVKHITT